MTNASPRLSARAANLLLATTNRIGRFLLVNTHNAARFFELHTDLKINVPDRKVPRRLRPENHTEVKLTKVDLTEFLERTLCDLRNPADWLMLSEKARAIAPVAVISALGELLESRHPVLNTVFKGFADWPSGSPIGTWIYLKKVEWGNIGIGSETLEEISRFVYDYREDVEIKSLLERSLLTIILSSGTGEQLDRFWANATTIRKEKLSINRQFALLRKLESVKGREEEATRLRAVFGAQASPFHELKLQNMDALNGRPPAGWNHAEAERRFVQTAPLGVTREFAEHIQPVYDALRPRMRLMDTRTDADRAEAFLSLVRTALESAAPFSLIRLSDGEGYLFPEGRFFDRSDAANRERHWWGVELPEQLRSQIVAEARQALATADIVGIPAEYRFIQFHSDNSSSVTRSVQGRGLLEVLKGVSGVISPDALITEAHVNVALFSKVDTIASLADLARKVIVVSSVKAGNLPAALTTGRRVEVVTIPTHHKTALNEKYYRGSQALPFIYPDLLKKLDELAGPGDLVLVAGGIVGKIFIARSRARGAVALDIGHTLDDWIHARLPSLR